MGKSLKVILFGEPRGIGNHNDCPGTNQFDTILTNSTLMSRVDRIHVHWSITLKKVSHQPWNNSYMVDRYGVRWEETEYLPQEQILKNIEKFMHPYLAKSPRLVTYDVHIREPSTLRWGKEYHKVIVDALSENYDYIMFHRPDSNIEVKKDGRADKRKLYSKFLDTDIPAVCITPNPNKTLWTYYDKGTETQPWAGFYVSWNAYEIMLWNRNGLILLEQFIKLKAMNEHKHVNFEYPGGFPEGWGVFQSWYTSQRIDKAEDFWSVVLLAISTFSHNFMVIDNLPFRSLIRQKGT